MKKPQILGSEKPICELGSISLSVFNCRKQNLLEQHLAEGEGLFWEEKGIKEEK